MTILPDTILSSHEENVYFYSLKIKLLPFFKLVYQAHRFPAVAVAHALLFRGGKEEKAIGPARSRPLGSVS